MILRFKNQAVKKHLQVVFKPGNTGQYILVRQQEYRLKTYGKVASLLTLYLQAKARVTGSCISMVTASS